MGAVTFPDGVWGEERERKLESAVSQSEGEPGCTWAGLGEVRPRPGRGHRDPGSWTRRAVSVPRG